MIDSMTMRKHTIIRTAERQRKKNSHTLFISNTITV